jgi:hypothetical protein
VQSSLLLFDQARTIILQPTQPSHNHTTISPFRDDEASRNHAHSKAVRRVDYFDPSNSVVVDVVKSKRTHNTSRRIPFFRSTPTAALLQVSTVHTNILDDFHLLPTPFHYTPPRNHARGSSPSRAIA